MCGIAGAIHLPLSANRIIEVMGHRGPDEHAVFHDGPITFFHLRLSILDAGGGKQPMHYLNRYTIIFNGEIYNHTEVRKSLNLTCTTNSDTETILHAYHAKGAAMLPLFDGMFAMAIYDKEEQTIFFARDRAGKKPLYYYHTAQHFFFASELNAIRASLPLHTDTAGFADYFRLGSFLGAQTPYLNVHELQPGSFMQLSLPSMHLQHHQWWQIQDYYLQPGNAQKLTKQQALHKVDELLQLAIQRRLESSDVEVGAFLSGGIDSGLITAIAARQHPQLQTFTVAFADGVNEAPLAAMVAHQYNTRHHELYIDFEELDTNVLRILRQYGEPFFDSSAIPSWYVSRAAAQHLKVILNGDGADELFGGYRRYVPAKWVDLFKRHTIWSDLAKTLSDVLPPANEKKSVYNFILRLMQIVGSNDPKEIYLKSTSDIFDGHLHAVKNIDVGTQKIASTVLFESIAYCKSLSGLDKLMLLDFLVTLPADLLVKMDIATMAHSIEGRSPFLSKELMEFAPGIPDELKINGRTTKYLLRQLATKYLPNSLIHQPKRGFEVPLKKWVNGQLQSVIHDYLTKSGVIFPQFIEHGFVQQLLAQKVKMSEEKRAKIIWTIFSMEVWHEHQQTLYRPASASSLA